MSEIEFAHPRTVPENPWWPYVKDRGPFVGRTGNGGTFLPMVYYSRAGDMLKVYWGPAESCADELDDRKRVTILRALNCNDLLQGVKIWGLSEVVPIEGLPAPKPRGVPSVKPKRFEPFAHYDATADDLLIRWLPGKKIVRQVETENIGHPMTMLLSATKHPEDPPKQKPWLMVGVIIHQLSAPQEMQSKGNEPKLRVPVQGRGPKP